jgi:hypothetical protein
MQTLSIMRLRSDLHDAPVPEAFQPMSLLLLRGVMPLLLFLIISIQMY